MRNNRSIPISLFLFGKIYFNRYKYGLKKKIRVKMADETVLSDPRPDLTTFRFNRARERESFVSSLSDSFILLPRLFRSVWLFSFCFHLITDVKGLYPTTTQTLRSLLFLYLFQLSTRREFVIALNFSSLWIRVNFFECPAQGCSFHKRRLEANEYPA